MRWRRGGLVAGLHARVSRGDVSVSGSGELLSGGRNILWFLFLRIRNPLVLRRGTLDARRSIFLLLYHCRESMSIACF
jgi:hypothetical protein